MLPLKISRKLKKTLWGVAYVGVASRCWGPQSCSHKELNYSAVHEFGSRARCSDKIASQEDTLILSFGKPGVVLEFLTSWRWLMRVVLSCNVYSHLLCYSRKWIKVQSKGWSACECVCSIISNSLWHMDYSLPGSSVHGLSQARILKWVTISFSRGSSWPRDWTQFSYISCSDRQILCC